jgi:archaeosine-15-forming tRNA-guanine transglycosylase
MSHQVRMTEDEQGEFDKKQELKRNEELKDLQKILELQEGMRFFKRFFDEGSMFSSTFTGNSQGMFLEGRRSLALKFFNDICLASPGKVPELIMRVEPKSS